MVKLEEAVTARLEKGGERFEILVSPDLAMKVKSGEKVDFSELMAVETIFKDAGRGTEQSPEAINRVFGTTSIEEAAKKIIMQGEVQLTTEQRRELKEKRTREIIQSISRNAINPQTGAPHPPQRIELAMKEAKIVVEAGKSAEEQMPKIIKDLKILLPISFEKLKLAVKIPAQFAGKAYSVLHGYGILKEEWLNDGSLVVMLEIPAGIKLELMNELNHITHGDVQVKIVEGS